MPRPAILITGAARRIGAVLAEAFAAEGWHIVIHYNRSETAALELADRLPSARCVQCDLEDGDEAAAMIERLGQELDDWRMLINNASIFAPDTASALDPNLFRRMMRINCETPTRMAQAYLALARSTGLRCVVDITDQKLANTNPDFFSYTASKHALAGTIPMLAIANTNPLDRIYGLAPGAILPSHDQSVEEIEISHRMNLLNRRTAPQDIAAAALFLSEGHLASGETIFVDAGQHLLRQDRDVIYLAREARG
ncbi:SDR family oxidoreductase [Altererythrobacter aurantiacus]|uniref:SDR family oxidoreductase n=1 Tax=Parapontixanthobacter aurantiacus TaxID=1463599 RepID=A0A844ZE77_9SPHN|nr:SDR family oxidoreductase [Parapontixanthobacter aurantiacus]MXO85552.1 SDR family oxidoreductase [Parapontixanthobacter aurantiacus]